MYLSRDLLLRSDVTVNYEKGRASVSSPSERAKSLVSHILRIELHYPLREELLFVICTRFSWEKWVVVPR